MVVLPAADALVVVSVREAGMLVKPATTSKVNVAATEH
jgi:hypothetical protein